MIFFLHTHTYTGSRMAIIIKIEHGSIELLLPLSNICRFFFLSDFSNVAIFDGNGILTMTNGFQLLIV